MKQIVIATIFTTVTTFAMAQNNPVDSTAGKVTVIKDPRFDLLGKKELEFNAMGTKAAKGFRLLVLKSNDHEFTMKVRALLLQTYPDQKVYMSFQAPFIKLKFGNFIEKTDAEKYRDMIIKAKIVTNNVYVVPDVVEVKPVKTKDGEPE
jgi:hypothetical protein